MTALQVAEKVSMGETSVRARLSSRAGMLQNESGFSPCKNKVSIEGFFFRNLFSR
jgi:hypothetical protein